MKIKKTNEEKKRRRRKYYEINREKLIENAKIYNSKNKEKLVKQKSEWYQFNKDRLAKKQKFYKEFNKQRISKRDKKYREANKEKIKDYRESNKYKYKYKEYLKKPSTKKRRNKYLRNKRKTDNNFRLREIIRKRFKQIFESYIKQKKLKSSYEYGIDYESIINHLKPFPEDISKYHIDHIKPLCKFKFVDEDGNVNEIEIQKAFAPENHQWLLIEDNLRKGGRYDERLFNLIKLRNYNQKML